MKKEIYTALYGNRLMRNDGEIETFERNLELLAETFTEEDIIELCSVLDDGTQNEEVMFGAVHLLETLSSETAFENIIRGIAKTSCASPEWADTIICRCQNDEFSVQMINRLKNRLDRKIYDRFTELLTEIRDENGEMFGRTVDSILTGP